MSDLIIVDDLPFEILTKVFRLLDVVSLKNATLTCKSWKNVIESECQWPLDYSELWSKQKVNFALTTNRKFGTIKITGSHLSDDNQIRQILQRHCFNVVKLILLKCRIQNLNQFADFLNFTPNLEHIVIDQINSDDASNVLRDRALPTLKKLKNLEIDCSHQRIIKCFQNAKLRTIKIWEDEHWTQRTQWEHGALVEFLLSQETLTSLTVLRGRPSQSILTELGKLNAPIPFRLAHLAVSGNICGQKFGDDDNHLLRFVGSQAEDLRELELGFGVPSVVYECVFCIMTKLNSLTLAISELPRGTTFYDQLEENCSVRTIKLLDVGHDARFVTNFFKKLPNIGSLILPYGNRSSGKALVMPQYLSKLESLSIRCIDQQSIDFVKFPNLKTLDIQYLRDKIDWNKLTKVHTLLTELTIGEMLDHSNLTSDDIDQITTNVDLHSIRLGVGFIADDRFFEIIRTKCTNLKVLELHKSCVPRRLNSNKRINVLRLCNRFQCSKHSNFSLYVSKV